LALSHAGPAPAPPMPPAELNRHVGKGSRQLSEGFEQAGYPWQ
jgi:hypothetical protein